MINYERYYAQLRVIFQACELPLPLMQRVIEHEWDGVAPARRRIQSMSGKRYIMPVTPEHHPSSSRMNAIESLVTSVQRHFSSSRVAMVTPQETPNTFPIPLLPGTLVDLVSSKSILNKIRYDVDTENPQNSGMLYSSAQFPKPEPRALVIVCHGKLGSQPGVDDAYQTVWDDLAEGLVNNDFIVASIRHTKSSNTEHARLAFQLHIKFLLENKGVSLKLLGKPVVLIGHSEGALAAILAGSDIAAQKLAPLVTSVRAIVALAPPWQPGLVVPNAANSLLVMQGTHDGDTGTIGATSVLAYNNTLVPFKSFAWLFGANHVRMLDRANQLDSIILAPDFPSAIDGDTQRLIVQNYTVGFLKWQCSNEQVFRPVFIGDGRFAWNQSPNPKVQGDLMAGRLRVFSRYDQQASPLTSAEQIVFNKFAQNGVPIDDKHPAKFAPLVEFTLGKTGQLSPESTKGFLVEWNRLIKANPMIVIPCSKDVMVKNPKFIEFQAVLAHDMVNIISGLLLPTFLVRKLEQIFVSSDNVNVIIAPPLKMITPMVSPLTRSILSTIRVPIASWGIKPPQVPDIVSLVLDFQGSPTPSGVIALADFRATLV